MTVNRVEDITDGAPTKVHDPHPKAGRRGAGVSGGKLVPFLVLIGLVAVAWMFKDKILAMIHH